MFENKTLKFEISKEIFMDVVKEYYSKNSNTKVNVGYDLSIKNESYGFGVYETTESHPSIEFYITEEIERNDIKGSIKSYLTENEIRDVLMDYASNMGYDFISFKYVGGIRNCGFYLDEDTPYFEGIQMLLKEKSMKRKLT